MYSKKQHRKEKARKIEENKKQRKKEKNSKV